MTKEKPWFIDWAKAYPDAIRKGLDQFPNYVVFERKTTDKLSVDLALQPALDLSLVKVDLDVKAVLTLAAKVAVFPVSFVVPPINDAVRIQWMREAYPKATFPKYSRERLGLEIVALRALERETVEEFDDAVDNGPSLAMLPTFLAETFGLDPASPQFERSMQVLRGGYRIQLHESPVYVSAKDLTAKIVQLAKGK